MSMSSAASHGVKVLGVVGAGQMGGGIAQVASQVAGLDVLLYDPKEGAVDDAKKLMRTLPTCTCVLAKTCG